MDVIWHFRKCGDQSLISDNYGPNCRIVGFTLQKLRSFRNGLLNHVSNLLLPRRAEYSSYRGGTATFKVSSSHIFVYPISASILQKWKKKISLFGRIRCETSFEFFRWKLYRAFHASGAPSPYRRKNKMQRNEKRTKIAKVGTRLNYRKIWNRVSSDGTNSSRNGFL